MEGGKEGMERIDTLQAMTATMTTEIKRLRNRGAPSCYARVELRRVLSGCVLHKNRLEIIILILVTHELVFGNALWVFAKIYKALP